ncbi:heme-binding protein 2-like [Leptodactylus fuscus]|uniref:heme-binding protein 2-like n=1 Tax=Leptodactylus fuscus TaxID=238119 RepID=UPI003F4F1C6A
MESRRALLLGLLAIFEITVAEQVYENPSQNQLPSFCRTRDCPRYQLVKQYDNFELRQYEETRWVTTPVNQDIIGIGMAKSFWRLFYYINGTNAEEQTMNMTVPVVMHMPLKEQSAEKFTMSFFVPHELENPPKPSDPAVYLETLPASSVYVKSFGGYAIHATFVKQAKALAEELRSLGLEFDDTYFVRVGYNAPFELFDRHNEVWYLAK